MDLQSDKRDFHLDIIPEEKRITSRKKLSAPRFFAFCTIYYSDATKAAILLQWVLNYRDNGVQKKIVVFTINLNYHYFSGKILITESLFKNPDNRENF